jgi:hypothetical protein
VRLLVVIVVGGAAAGLAVTLIHAGDEVYGLPWWAVALAVAGFVAVVAGGVLLWRSGAAGRGLLAALAVALGLVGLVAIFSIGVLLLAAAALVAVLLATRLRPTTRTVRAGALVGVGLPLIALTALSDPLVDCESGRSGENVFLGLGSDESSAEGASFPDGRSFGRSEGDGYAYEYECREGELVRFDFRDR